MANARIILEVGQDRNHRVWARRLGSTLDDGPRDLPRVSRSTTAAIAADFGKVQAGCTVDAVIARFFHALKQGLTRRGVRGRADQPQDPSAKSGYVAQDVMIALSDKACFKLAATTEANANPKARDRYAAIDESDRMLPKFVTP